MYGGRFGHISYAQHGDDFMIMNLFTLLGIDQPSYLDLGAHHPTQISNTALLYQRGSRGVNVEANPKLIEVFNQMRPGDTNLCLAVGLGFGKKQLFLYEELSGLNSLIASEVPGGPKGSIEVECVMLEWLIKNHCQDKFPDFLNLDVEGMDYAILATYPFKNDRPKVVCVETRHPKETEMIAMMSEQGFKLVCRMLENLFFVSDECAKKLSWLNQR